MTSIIIDLQLWSCVFMTGLIWTIQLVHYPSFHHIKIDKFSQFEGFHSNRISWIVLPVMSVELLTAVVLIFLLTESLILIGVNFLSVAAIWLITLHVSARIHTKLMSGYNESLVNQLIFTNWARTFLWSARSVFLIFFLKSFL